MLLWHDYTLQCITIKFSITPNLYQNDHTCTCHRRVVSPSLTFVKVFVKPNWSWARLISIMLATSYQYITPGTGISTQENYTEIISTHGHATYINKNMHLQENKIGHRVRWVGLGWRDLWQRSKDTSRLTFCVPRFI